MTKKDYDCFKCPGYCCSYPRIAVSNKDIKRIAKHFSISVETARTKYTHKYKFKNSSNKINETILRHKKDEVYKSTCQFLDSNTRGCSIYEARPRTCRDYPETNKCGYYQFLKFERKQQDDESFTPTC